MRTVWQKICAILRREDHGQDLAEYTLILAFLCVIVLAVVVRLSGGISAIWTTGNNVIATANSAASGPGAASSDGHGH